MARLKSTAFVPYLYPYFAHFHFPLDWILDFGFLSYLRYLFLIIIISNQMEKEMRRRRRQQQEVAEADQQSRVFDELSALVLSILPSPHSPFRASDFSPSGSAAAAGSRPKRPSPTQISPAGFASLLFGISVSMMLCGSVTFFIGFILMPWVVGLFLVFYAIGIVSMFSLLGRAILVHASARATPRKDLSAWKLT